MSKIILVVLVLTIHARAESAESKLLDKRLRSLIAASTAAQIESVVGTYSEIESARLRCDVQLSGQRIPEACFAAIEVERGTGLLKDPRLDFNWLESLCQSRAKKSVDIQELRRAEESASLPSKCRDIIRERVLDLEYAAEAAKPAKLFEDRLSIHSH